MRYSDFILYMNSRPSESPVILLEGKRLVREEDKPLLVAFGEQLARELPRCVFRSGNAAGADDLFVQGVARVAPERIQLVLPNQGHGRQRVPAGAGVYSLDSMDMVQEETVIYQTRTGTKKNAGLVDAYLKSSKGAVAAKAAYLLRDTVKITGAKGLALAPADFAIFYDDLEQPESGGTGHTIRVGRLNNIPMVNQMVFFSWLVKD